MSYNPVNWVNGETPINDTNLNNMDNGIAEAHKILADHDKKIDDFDEKNIIVGFGRIYDAFGHKCICIRHFFRGVWNRIFGKCKRTYFYDERKLRIPYEAPRKYQENGRR